MKYFNLLILFMITLKCRGAEESTTIKYFTVEEYSNTEALSTSTTESKFVNINISSEHNQSENSPTNNSDDDAVDVKKVEDGLPISRRLVQQGTRMVKDIGSFIKGIAQLKETNLKDDGADDSSQKTDINTTSYATDDNEEKKEVEEPTTVFCLTDENVTNREVSNTSTTEASENAPIESTQLPNINGSSEDLMTEYTTNANTVGLLTNKEFGKLSIPKKPRQRTRTVVKIIGSLMEGLAQLNEPTSREDDRTNNEEVMNVTNSEVFNAVNKTAPENIVNKWTRLPNINSPSETSVIENTLIKAASFNGVTFFKNKELGKLPIPKKPRQRTRTVTSIIGNFMEGLARLNEPVLEEDEGANDKEQTTVNNFIVTNINNSEGFNAITTEAPENIVGKWTHVPNINSSSETPRIENTLIKAPIFNAVSPFKNKEFGNLPIPKKPRQRPRNVVKIIGSLMEGLTRLNEPYLEEDAAKDDKETTIVNLASVENVTSSEVFKATIIEAPEDSVNEWTDILNSDSLIKVAGAKTTLNKATVLNAVSPFKNKEVGKLPIPNKPRQRTEEEKVAKIIGSLNEQGLARLNEPDSGEDAGVDNEDTTTANGSKVENVTNSEVYYASTTEASKNLVDKWTPLANTNSLSDPTVSHENTLIHATDAVSNPFKKEIGKLPISIRLPQQGSQLMRSIIGRFVKGLVQGTDANKDED